MASFMEMIFIDPADDNARMTDMAMALESDAATWRAFQSYRRFDVGADRATFLLDYHNRKGDIADTIRLDDGGFTAITGQEPKAAAVYRKIDRDYWNAVRKAAA